MRAIRALLCLIIILLLAILDTGVPSKMKMGDVIKYLLIYIFMFVVSSFY